jgi:hypothetical protein
MPPTPCHGHDAPTMEPDHIRPAGHHRTHHQAGLVPLDRPRGQLSHRAALFLYDDPVGLLLWAFFRQHVDCPQDVSHSLPSGGEMCHCQQRVTAKMSPNHLCYWYRTGAPCACVWRNSGCACK